MADWQSGRLPPNRVRDTLRQEAAAQLAEIEGGSDDESSSSGSGSSGSSSRSSQKSSSSD
eukprot:3606991-Pyramimonas_sp.AAC.1